MSQTGTFAGTDSNSGSSGSKAKSTLRHVLGFEQPMARLEQQIVELEALQDSKGVDYTSELRQLRENYTSLLRKTYDGLNAWETVQVARHPQRPLFKDYVELICREFRELHGDRYFGDDPAMLKRVQALAAKTRELTDFLANELKIDSVPGRFDGRVTYHDCCAGLREMGVKTQPRSLLAKVAGLTVEEMAEPETCCGFGGTFSIKFGEISARLADNKCGHITASGADAVVLGDLGCMLNIEGRLRRLGDRKTRVLHVAEVLAGEGT